MPSLKTIIVLLLLICVRANVHKQQYVSLSHTNVITTLAVQNRTLTTIAPVNTSTRSMQNATLSAKNAKTAFYSRYEPVRTAVQIYINMSACVKNQSPHCYYILQKKKQRTSRQHFNTLTRQKKRRKKKKKN